MKSFSNIGYAISAAAARALPRIGPVLKSYWFILLALLTVWCSRTLYTVSETEQVIITRFGRPIGNPINASADKSEAGLHFKWPLHKINRMEKRLVNWDGPIKEMPTKDKLYIVVDNFARWKIVDPAVYLRRCKTQEMALSLLDDIISGEIRNIVAENDLIETVRNDKSRHPQKEAAIADNPEIGNLVNIQFGRNRLSELLLERTGPKVAPLGIEIIDIEFKRVGYSERVLPKIYERMMSERAQISAKFISEGSEKSEEIDGNREKKLAEIKASAYTRDQELRGQGDQIASDLYTKAWMESPSAREFYKFTQTLETYRAGFDGSTQLILSTDSELFKLLKVK